MCVCVGGGGLKVPLILCRTYETKFKSTHKPLNILCVITSVHVGQISSEKAGSFNGKIQSVELLRHTYFH